MSGRGGAEYREGPSALDEVVRRLRDALDLITFFTAGEKETRAWTLRRGPDGARGGGVDPLRHRARLHPLRDDLDRGSARRRLARGGVEARDPAARGQDLRGPGRRRPEHPLQRLAAALAGPEPVGEVGAARSGSGTRSRGASRRRARRAGRGRRAPSARGGATRRSGRGTTRRACRRRRRSRASRGARRRGGAPASGSPIEPALPELRDHLRGGDVVGEADRPVLVGGVGRREAPLEQDVEVVGCASGAGPVRSSSRKRSIEPP